MFHLISKRKYKKKTACYQFMKTEEYKAVAKSKLFDKQWYLSKNPDVKNASVDPIEHYIKYGWKEARECTPYFDGNEYLRMYPDVAKANVNPLVHWEIYGKKEGRFIINRGSVNIIERIKNNYVKVREELIARFSWKEFSHKIADKYSKKYKGKSQDYKLIAKSKYFNKRWYLKQNPDVKKAGIDPVEHYLKYGYKEGRNPSKEFDGSIYLSMYRTVAIANINPLLHYEKYGYKAKLKIEPQIVEFPCGTKNIFINNLSTKKNKIKRVAVFASYSANGKIDDYILYYLKGLKKVCDSIIFVSDNPLFPSEADKLLPFVDYAFISRHGEYDFGSYKRGYQIAKTNHILEHASELILCNDSCYGPVYPFKRMFNAMENTQSDFWGICANDEYNYHLQSFFLVFKKNVFSSSVFADFLSSVKHKNNVSSVVIDYEIKLTPALNDAGFMCDSYIPLNTKENSSLFMYTRNLTLFPLTLMKLGCPLLKVKALTKLGCNYEGCPKKIYDYIYENNSELTNYLPKLDELKQDVSFSIIMPTYNRKNFIDKAVDSVLRQTYQNFELIIVDDGSTDNTKKFIQKQYSKELKSGKIKYIYKENSGVCATRNIGLRHAKNKWIAYLDSDNLLFPCFLETFATNIQKHKNKTFYAKCISMKRKSVIGKEFDYKKLIKANYIDLGIFVHHRTVYEKLGGFDEKMTRLVDWDLITCYTKKYKPYFIPAKVMLYNDIDDHVRITNSANYYENLRYFKKKHAHLDLYTVTAMITSYNHEKYIAQAIDSAIKQRGDFILEIIISDDGSTDNTPQIIAEYAEKYPHLIKNISQKQNVGISANMRRCFEVATGKYIAVLEGDDYWTDIYKLDKQRIFLEHNKDCSMVFSKLQVLNEQTQKRSFLERQRLLSKKLDGTNCINEPSLNLMGNFSCCMFVSKHMKKLPEILYKYRLNEIALSFYLEQKGKIGFISEPLSVYRQHVNGVWTGADKINRLKSGLQCRQTAYAVCRDKYKKQLKKIIEEQYIKPLKELEDKAV